MSVQRDNRDRIVLSLVLLASGLVGPDLSRPDAGLYDLVRSAVEQPYRAGTFALAAAILLAAFEYRVAAAASAAGAFLLSGYDLLALSAFAARSAIASPAVVAGLTGPLVAAGVVGGLLPLSGRMRRALALTPSTVAMAIGAPLLIGSAVDGTASAASVTVTYPAIAGLVLGGIWIYLVVCRNGDPAWVVSREFVWSSMLSLLVSLGVLQIMPRAAPAPSMPQRIPLSPGELAVAIGLVAAVAAGVKFASDAYMLRRTVAKLHGVLKRQRRLTHGRARELRRSRAHYAALFANVPLPVVLTSLSGRVVAGNPALLELLGCESEEQLKGTNISQFYADPEQTEELVARWESSSTGIHHGEIELRRLDGARRNVLYATRYVRGADGTIDYLQGTITDITGIRLAEAEQRRLESNLRLSQKLESVGRLAAGIAHEINTPMQYIGDNVFFLEQSFATISAALEERRRAGGPGAANPGGSGSVSSACTAPAETATRAHTAPAEPATGASIDGTEVDFVLHEVPGALARAREGIDTVNHIVAAIKELAHPGKGSKVGADINSIVDTALTVTRNAYKTVAEVRTVLAELPAVPVYKNELCQVLINLIVNAAQAIESRGIFGSIEIETSLVGSFVTIRIADNGCGIPRAALDDIFDPFFTTKGVGKGTGQGLSIARSIVTDKHDGEISVESTVGTGTVFSIKLPVASPDSTAGAQAQGGP